MGFGQALLSQLTVAKVILGLVAYVGLRFLYQIVYYRFFHPLSAFPGPFWGSVTRLWIAWHNLRETEVPTVHALTKKYGMHLKLFYSDLSLASTDSFFVSPQALSSASHLLCSWLTTPRSFRKYTTGVLTRPAIISPEV